MGPLRILRVIPDLQVGGVQRMLFRSLETLAARGVSSEIACLASSPGDLAESFERAGFPVHILGFSSRLDPVGLWRLRRHAVRGGFHLVHSHMYAANMAANVALLGRRDIAILNGYHSWRPTQTPGQTRKVRITQNKPDAFLAVSRAVADALVAIGVPESRIRIVYNGISLPDGPAPLPPPGEDAVLRLVWIGRFVRQKRVPFLIEVLDQCRRRGVPVRLTLVGDGPRRDEVESLVTEKGLGDLVRYTGFSNQVDARLREADLFLSASDREGFSNTVLEAAAAGRGMLLSDIPPHREFLTAASAKSGAAVPGGDANAPDIEKPPENLLTTKNTKSTKDVPRQSRDQEEMGPQGSQRSRGRGKELTADNADVADETTQPIQRQVADPITAAPGGFLLGDDPAAWCDVLESLSHDPDRLALMGRASFETVRQFSLESVTGDLHALYCSLVEAKGR